MPNPGRQKATQRIWPNAAGGELESNKALSVHLCALRWIILLWYYYQTTATTSFPDYNEDINLLYAFWRMLVHPKTIVRNSIVSDNNPRGTRLTQDNNECFYAEPNLCPWSSGIPRQQPIRWWSIASTTRLVLLLYLSQSVPIYGRIGTCNQVLLITSTTGARPEIDIAALAMISPDKGEVSPSAVLFLLWFNISGFGGLGRRLPEIRRPSKTRLTVCWLARTEEIVGHR